MPKKLNSVFWRSFLVQAGWNFERMQNLGFAYMLEPALRKIWQDEGQRREALKRHLEFFNTHPYLSTLIAGAVLSEEEKAAASGDVLHGAEASRAIKASLMAPLAALGDELFWATLRPFAALGAVAVAWMAPELGPLTAALTYLVLFNAPHWALRAGGLRHGHSEGADIVAYLREVDIRGVGDTLKLAGMTLLGALLAGLGGFHHPGSGAIMPFGDNFLFMGAGIMMLMGLRLKVSVTKILVATALIALVLGWINPHHFSEPLS